MAKGFDKKKERAEKVSLLGKFLVKRAKSSCEMCEAKNVPLTIYEVPPVDEEPTFDRAFMICGECKDSVERFSKVDGNRLRFLNSSIWSEVPIVKALSLYILRAISEKHRWAEDLLETAYVEEEVEELVKSVEL